MHLLVGNDNGNAEQDMVINGRRISAPNVFARVGKLVNLDELNPEHVTISSSLWMVGSTMWAHMHSRAVSGVG